MKYNNYILLLILLFTSSCGKFPGGGVKSGSLPSIVPDYIDVTIPQNIAPLNFIVKEKGEKFRVIAYPEKGGENVKIISEDGKIMFPLKDWRKLTAASKGGRIKLEVAILREDGSVAEHEPFFMNVAEEPVDPYLAYRLIPPGYYSWSRIRIMQRCLEDYSESTVVENTILDKNCVNCHSFANNNPDRFMVHIRGNHGGTYFMENGEIKRTDPKIESMPGSATYPSWHPGGRYIAYSSNQVRQSFYAEASKSIEVFDLAGSMVLYDTKDNEIISITEEDTANYLRTFPGWSSDGKYLYYCRALNTVSPENPDIASILSVHHDLVRKRFDEATETFGRTEVVFAASAAEKSVSFPRISPDGKYLIFTLANNGTFPIWHAEADLYSLNLETSEILRLDLNSDEADSYHSWSSNGRWMVFSSKRSDGRSTRPYIAYMTADGKSAKPFMLPQKDPEVYSSMIESFNIPEFITGKIKAGPRDFLRAAGQVAVKSKSGDKVNGPVNNLTGKSNTNTTTQAHQ